MTKPNQNSIEEIGDLQKKQLEEIKDLLKKQLVLNLYALSVSQGEIAKKLHMDVHRVNEFLKGVKKINNEKN